MNDREILENITNRIKDLSRKIENVSHHVVSLEERQKSLDDLVANLIQIQGRKLDLLFEGYKQNSERLDRIENDVSKQEEFILRRIK